MPSLPRLRRTRPRVLGEGVDARPQPRIAEVHAAELAWIHLEAVDPDLVNYLRSRFGWHALDVEDVLSKRQRPKVDDYADEGYLFGVLHFPAYDKNIQRLNAAELYFDDLVDASERIWDQLDNFKEVVEALESTNESVISHRQNDVLRVLTVVSVILLPLTLVTGIFGMNVRFPGWETSAGFWTIVGVMLAIAFALVGFFRYKRWL